MALFCTSCPMVQVAVGTREIRCLLSATYGMAISTERWFVWQVDCTVQVKPRVPVRGQEVLCSRRNKKHEESFDFHRAVSSCVYWLCRCGQGRFNWDVDPDRLWPKRRFGLPRRDLYF